MKWLGQMFGKKESKDGHTDKGERQVAGAAGGGVETLADDGPLAPDKRAVFERDEAIVRDVLQLVGVDYDALIAMDGRSPYARAVAANPALVQDILTDERPVLAAMRVVLSPDMLKPPAVEPEVVEEEPVKVGGPLFSHRFGRGIVKAEKKTDLGSVFGK